MSSAESWLAVQVEQAEENALVADLADRGQNLLLNDIPVLMAAFERVNDLRAQHGKRMSRRNLEALENLGAQLAELRRVMEDLQA